MRQPRPDAKIGPIVEPQAMSDLTQNSWVGMPRLVANSLHKHNSARCSGPYQFSLESSMCPGTAIATSAVDSKYFAQQINPLCLPFSFSSSRLIV